VVLFLISLWGGSSKVKNELSLEGDEVPRWRGKKTDVREAVDNFLCSAGLPYLTQGKKRILLSRVK
jgi:hypothetical protein